MAKGPRPGPACPQTLEVQFLLSWFLSAEGGRDSLLRFNVACFCVTPRFELYEIMKMIKLISLSMLSCMSRCEEARAKEPESSSPSIGSRPEASGSPFPFVLYVSPVF